MSFDCVRGVAMVGLCSMIFGCSQPERHDPSPTPTGAPPGSSETEARPAAPTALTSEQQKLAALVRRMRENRATTADVDAEDWDAILDAMYEGQQKTGMRFSTNSMGSGVLPPPGPVTDSDLQGRLPADCAHMELRRGHALCQLDLWAGTMGDYEHRETGEPLASAEASVLKEQAARMRADVVAGRAVDATVYCMRNGELASEGVSFVARFDDEGSPRLAFWTASSTGSASCNSTDSPMLPMPVDP